MLIIDPADKYGDYLPREIAKRTKAKLHNFVFSALFCDHFIRSENSQYLTACVIGFGLLIRRLAGLWALRLW